MSNLYVDLLTSYCDGLISLQYRGEDPAFYGGFWCRSCKMIHGRGPDAVYPLAVMYKRTGEDKYLQAAQACFDYGEQMTCTDGALYNDAQAAWLNTTVFHTISVIETLRSLKGRLPKAFEDSLYARAKRMAKWLFDNLHEHSGANINYATTNALALQLAGMTLHEPKYLAQAAHLASYAMAHFSPNGLFFGESKNHDEFSPLGCRSVDIGYDMEESVPSLVKYARLAENEAMLNTLTTHLRGMSNFVLPDGALDNSFGIRNNKWTYWGSRTSDGIAPAYLLLADREPYFAACAYRNTQLQQRCTHDGLLYGGPHYKKNGQYPCTHHTFEHANAVAFAVDEIDERYLVPQPQALPIEREQASYYPEIHTYKITRGDITATITGYDCLVPFSGHASGGTLTMLWSRTHGAMIAASVTSYEMAEPTNMQLPLDREHHRPLVPRLTKTVDGTLYSSSFFDTPDMHMAETEDAVRVTVQGGLATRRCTPLAHVHPRITYTVTRTGVQVDITDAAGLTFVLPLIAGELSVACGHMSHTDRIFFLTGGFEATEYTIAPSTDGAISFTITV